MNWKEHTMRYLLLLTSLLAVLLIPKMSSGETSDENTTVPNMFWETAIQDVNLEYELKGSAVTPDGSQAYLLLGSRPKGKTSGHQDMRLQAIDVIGKLQTSIELNSYFKKVDTPEFMMNGGGMAISAAGVVYLAFPETMGQLRYIGVDVKTRQIPVNRMIKFDFPISLIYKMLLTKSGTLLLVGSADRKGFIAEIGNTGNIMWQEQIDAPISVILDVIEVKNGYAIVGGIVGNPPFFLFKEIWAGRVNARGKLLQSLSLPGTAGFTASIAQSSSGQFVICYNRLLGGPESELSQVVVQGLSREFQPIWNKMLSSPNKGYSQVSIKNVLTGGYIVAATSRNRWISRLQDDGTEIPIHSTKVIAPDYPIFNGVDLLRAGKDFVLASGVSVVRNRTQQQIVKVTKVTIK